MTMFHPDTLVQDVLCCAMSPPASGAGWRLNAAAEHAGVVALGDQAELLALGG